MTNLTTHIDDYTDTKKPLFTLIDNHSFYIINYFKKTKLHHIHENTPTQITLYNDNKTLQNHISNIDRTIYNQNIKNNSNLIPNIKPNIP